VLDMDDGDERERVEEVALARLMPVTALPQAPRKRELGVRGVWGVRGVVTSPRDETVDVDETEVERQGDGGGGIKVRGEGAANVAGVYTRLWGATGRMFCCPCGPGNVGAAGQQGTGWARR
jgi:hypothetical protein